MTKSRHLLYTIEYKDKTIRSVQPVKFPEVAKTMTQYEYMLWNHNRYYQENKVALNQYRHQKYLLKRTDEQFMEHYRELNRDLRWRTKLDAINHYSSGTMNCACCGENEVLFLTIDHIANDGAKHRRLLREQGRKGGNRGLSGYKFYQWLKANNYPAGFQVLCMNCNLGKQINGGICPHQTKMLEALV